MKKHTTTLRRIWVGAMAMIFGCMTLYAQSGKIDQTELDFLVNYLEVSLDDTKKTLAQVDEELWAYKPPSGGWSVGECMEHILLAETALFKQIKGSLAQPAMDDKSLSFQDGYVITRTVDRGKKVNTPLKPETVRMSKQAYLETIEKSRKEIIAFVSQDDLGLRNHFGRSPFGEVDTYQLVLIIAGHGMRHTAQMREIIATAKGVAASY